MNNPAPSVPRAGSMDPGLADHRSGRRQAVMGLVLAGLIIAAAWWIGGRAGWTAIGDGGMNQQVLPKVGDAAPNFQTEDVFGNPVQLADYAGQPIWLMFWGSWCPPCRSEFPDIVSAYRQVEPDGVNLLAVSLRESPLEAAAYAGRNRADFLVLSDPDQTDLGRSYPIFNFPTHIFIGRDGTIKSVVLKDMDVEQALAEVAKITDAPASALQQP